MLEAEHEARCQAKGEKSWRLLGRLHSMLDNFFPALAGIHRTEADEKSTICTQHGLSQIRQRAMVQLQASAGESGSLTCSDVKRATANDSPVDFCAPDIHSSSETAMSPQSEVPHHLTCTRTGCRKERHTDRES